MKNLKLDFGARLGLSGVLALTSGLLGKMTVLQRIYEVVRFTEGELSQVKVTDLGNGASKFEPPSPSFGRIEIQVEEGDCQVLRQEIETSPHIRLSDVPWATDLKAQLAEPSVFPKRRK